MSLTGGDINMQVEVNYLAVLVAALAGMAVGFVWYSSLLFAKPWMREMGYKKETMKKDGMTKMYIISMIATVVMAYVLSHVMYMSENFFMMGYVTTGLLSAFWMWLGFVATVQVTDVLFGGKSWKLFGINTGYQLVSLLVMGLIIGLFGI